MGIQISIVSSRGVFVNKESTPNNAMYKSGFWLRTSVAKEQESLHTNLLMVNGEIIGTRYFAKWYEGVSMAERTCVKGVGVVTLTFFLLYTICVG